MLQYVTTPLFDSPAQTLVNTVNTVGVMGKGIAAEFKRRYPEMFTRYKRFCETGQLDIGKLYLYRTPNKWVLNFPTKKHWRNPSKLEYIELGLEKFVDTYSQMGITSVSFPQLGCGNGGLDWNVVRPVMERYLQQMPIPVYVHVTERRRNFVPEHLDRKELLRFRQDIGFMQFWNDLREAAQADAPAVSSYYEEGGLQPLVFRSGGRTLSIPGEDFEDFWNSLRLRGAIASDAFPGVLKQESDEVIKLLRRLHYIQLIEFASTDSSGRKQYRKGVRFSPPAAIAAPALIDLETMS